MKFYIVLFFMSALIASINCGSDPYSNCDILPDVGFPCADSTGPSDPTVYYFYDFVTGFCEVLNYLGCGGNENIFPSSLACETHCIVQGDARPSAA
ncbi:CLUMA_CG016412, isoform A [Clunio marinus]|uniref:CLUMA_CG016412, isoform A n=1 Tax=Clunio marinus TaxID=568069 RepID=A0A1J1ITF7_9DIPT|nr:CLUMA_CG016412, isoform A [Clunio marinus]